VIISATFAVETHTVFLWLSPRATRSPFWTGQANRSWTAQPGTDFVVSKEALEEFKRIYAAEHGVELSDKVALELAANLLTFMNAVYRPVKKEWFK
jgi:hypothetical protein